ncbi:MAG TPA: hypothetical protein PK006_07440 [Saprospiraceae bacterium]|nr:hypothetical protein [Saprospiraceae bacterium]
MRKNLIALFLILACFIGLNAQLSPGKLSQAHSHLEGTQQCTQCHELGQKVPNQKCLQCHKAVNERVIAKKGFHSSNAVAQKQCVECHSDHHGLKFEMVRFDEKKFDHQLAGYKLEGAHAKVECRSCHKSEFVVDAELKKNQNTYLGLRQACNSCHQDVHQNTLSKDCAKCHDNEVFSPAKYFQHQKTRFPLIGKHQSVACLECHPKSIQSGKEFQKFAGIGFQSCANCHQDVHQGKFGKDCKVCHQEVSFHQVQAKSGFNHAMTGFELQGKHKSIDCKSCHDQRNQAKKMFQEFVKSTDHPCLECHQDEHKGKFGANCLECHNQNSFRSLQASAQFDHGLTEFPLLGKHKSVECKQCHKTKMIDPVAHSQCKNCHEDYHQAEFNEMEKGSDCKHCHSEQGFDQSSYSLESHQQSSFPLKGAHQAISCELCHHKATRWKFRSIGQQCKDCHEDIHKNFISERFYPEQNCALCHQEEAWASVQFDHSKTNFVLRGKHIEQSCKSCHFKNEKGQTKAGQVFANLSHECSSCHSDVHERQFEKEAKTECKACHQEAGWLPSIFDHNLSRFILEGKHKDLSCSACHTAIEPSTVVVFRNGRLDCKDCHR